MRYGLVALDPAIERPLNSYTGGECSESMISPRLCDREALGTSLVTI